MILGSSQYFQVGLVSGGVSTKCGDKNIPTYFTRLDHPLIATFIATPDISLGKGEVYLDLLHSAHCIIIFLL